MTHNSETAVHLQRLRLGNPYAHIDGDGQMEGYNASLAKHVQNPRLMSQDPYAYLDGDGRIEYLTSSNHDTPAVSSTLIDPAEVLGGTTKGSRLSDADIEKVVRRLHRQLWGRRKELCPGIENVGALDLLNPQLALQCLGYDVHFVASLGQFGDDGGRFDVAGILDRERSSVSISLSNGPQVRNFTAAHELAHVILHEGTGLHRDRALDNKGPGKRKDMQERQADVFASYFLMPAKMVRSAFQQAFLSTPFQFNLTSLSAFSRHAQEALQRPGVTLRDKSRLFASVEFYNGEHFHSLATQFGVSEEAMAIRLEELTLIRP